MVKFDDILSEVNEFGRFQKSRYALICLAALLPPICTYLHSFIAARPLYRCTHSSVINDTYSPFNHSLYSSYFNANVTFQKCSYTINDTVHNCEKWIFDRTYYEVTLTEEWSMVCNRSILRSNVQTVYFCGYLVGSFLFGILADRFGRRPVMLFSFIVIILGGFFATFGPQKSFGVSASYTIYTIGRFMTAVGTRGINVIGFVLAMELVGPDKRTMAGIFFKYFFAFGQFILVFFAWSIRDWRVLSIIVLASGFPFLTYFFFIPESLRWLVSKGRNAEAFKILKKVCEVNKTNLKEESWKQFLNDDKNTFYQSEHFLDIFKAPLLAILLLVLSLNWAANNFLFYGLGLKANDLGLNPYQTYAISVACELMGYIVIFVLISKYGRKIPYFFFQLLAGLCCFAIIFTNDPKKVVIMAMLGKFFAASTYAVIQLYSSEMFPTSIRNSCMGTCSMIARLGPIAAPMVNNLGDRKWKSLPFLVFGISGVFAALSTLVLPETKDRDLPQSIEESTKLFKIKCLPKISKSQNGSISRNNKL